MPTTTRKRVLTAVVAGATATAYYAVPDFVPSRTARGWIKAGLLAAGAAASLPDREERAQMRASWDDAMSARAARLAAADGTTPDGETPDGETPDGGTTPDAPPSSVPALVVAGVALVAATTVASVAAERWLFRRGEARAAAGVRYPHTRTALVLGGLSTLLGLIPDSDERESATSERA